MSQDFTNLSYHETRINGNHNILGDVANESSFPYNSSTQNMPLLDSSYLSFLECLQGSTSTFVKEETKPLLEVEEAKAIIEVNALQKEDLSKTMKQEKNVENFAYDGGENPTNKENKQKKKGEKKQKEERYAFMTKSEVDHLDDGYKWRKYGQKAVKNSSYPRSYYRCTTQKCPVKKRVERSLQDPTIVMTTYEGKHNHHLPANRIGNVAAMLPPYNILTPPPQSMMTTAGVSHQDSIFHRILMPHSYNSYNGHYSTRNNDSIGYAYEL